MKRDAIGSVLLFAGMILVNFLANALPINGLNTGQISALYPNLFVPDGLTFSIWGIIYLLLLGFVAYGLVLTLRSDMPEYATATWRTINPWFQITCLLNMAWILVWHYLQVVLSLLVMILFLVVLIRIFLLIRRADNRLSPVQRLLLLVPFVVYMAWICVATVANTTALLVHFGWGGFGWPQEAWAIGMLGVLGILGLWITGVFNQPPFGLVAGWAAMGVYRAQYGVHTTVAYAAVFVAILMALVTVYAWVFNRRVVRQF